MRIAIDTGGTFTDCVALLDGRLAVHKLASTPDDPGRAVLEGVRELAQRRPAGAHSLPLDARHGTTVGTNAMLERKGARVAFVTTAGFEDTIAIGRQTRPALYAFTAPPPFCIVPPGLRFGLRERVTAEGHLLLAPTDADLAALVAAVRASGAEAIALSLLFAFLNPANERRAEQALRTLNLPVSTGHRLHPEFREYERASTLAVNAYLAPRMERYLLDLDARVVAWNLNPPPQPSTEPSNHPPAHPEAFAATLPSPPSPAASLQVMQSSGGIIAARTAAQEPVRTVLSGPAGGVIGAWSMARAAGLERIIGFDMGGTSTDVFLADAATGGPSLTQEGLVAGVPVSVPMLDIHTAGAGGGSLARFDAGGLLRVGPESAGAHPGPICFGRGEQPTVTDANLLLGRLDANRFMGGVVALDHARTRAHFDRLKGPLATPELFAAGILRVVEAQMERAIRVVSVQRGHDPRRCTLVAFGGGGPLHGCAVARALDIPHVLVPRMPGALSALGILLADAVRDYAQTVMLPGTALPSLAAAFAALEARAAADPHPSAVPAGSQPLLERSLDLRYRGQGYEINLPYTPHAAAEFHRIHARRFGFQDPARPLEIVSLRLRVRLPTEPFHPTPEPLVPGDGAQALRSAQPACFDGLWHTTPLYDRTLLRPGDTFPGPALIAEYTATTVLPPAAQLTVDALGNLLLAVGP